MYSNSQFPAETVLTMPVRPEAGLRMGSLAVVCFAWQTTQHTITEAYVRRSMQGCSSDEPGIEDTPELLISHQ